MNTDTAYTLVVWCSKKRPGEREAAHMYEKICQGNLEDLVVSEDITAFVAEITEKYPAIDALPEADHSQCPWGGPFTVTDHYAILPLRREWGKLVKPLLNKALKHNLTYYDPQNQMVFNPLGMFAWLKKMKRHVMP
ncbi:MAG TPA: hypothetical protein VN611_17330 [Patescibacteria group bacterium]|nr:hypothetical protein [Patescibacteria group bacterium]